MDEGDQVGKGLNFKGLNFIDMFRGPCYIRAAKFFWESAGTQVLKKAGANG